MLRPITFGSLMISASLLAGCGAPQTEETAPESVQERAQEPAQETAAAPETTVPTGDAAITAEELASHIKTLSSDEFEGRAPTTAGGEKTRAYIADEFQRLGLEPVNGSYFQSVPMLESTLDPEQSSLTINGPSGERSLGYRDEAVFWTKRAEETVTFENSDVVFVGYGVVAPEYGWNDYEGIDATGKTVVMLVNDPGFATQDPELFNGNAMTYYGRWTYKYEEAARQGAAAAIVIHETAPAAYGWGVVEGSWSGPQLDLVRSDNGASRVALEGWITHDVAEELFSNAGLDLEAEETRAMSADFTPVALEGMSATGTLTQTLKVSEDANVVGVLPGAERPDEYVLYMGHWDHLGRNDATEGDDKIYNGAVDNATGIASILEIAEKFAAGDRPARSVIFAGVTAEESGLLGSAYMAENPLVPLKNIVAGINIDAFLPTPPAKDIIVVGYGASELEDLLEDAATPYDRVLTPDPEPQNGYFYRSDHISFAKKGVPMLYADSGLDLREGGPEAGDAIAADYTEHRYHKPADEYADDWDMRGMTEMSNILFDLGAGIATSDAWPNWYDGNEFRALRDEQRSGD